MEQNEIDKLFPYMVGDRNQSGGKSEVLTNTPKHKTPKESSATTAPLRESKDTHTQIIPPTKQVFLPQGRNSNERFEFTGQRDNSAANSRLGGRFRDENGFETNSCFVGLHHSMITTSLRYPNKAGRSVLLRGMCVQQRPRLIGGNDGVVVYDIAEPDNGLLKPVVKWFAKNMEEAVPHELVKIGHSQ